MMRAAIYARVSGAGQRDAHTIESQLRVLPAYVASQGWTLVDTYVDDGKSARTGKLDHRDGFARLVRDAAAGKFDVVVVVQVDRLTRTDDAQERAAILGPFQRAGVCIATPGAGLLDLKTLMGELYVTMHALFAAEENRKRAERIREGKLSSALRGGKATGWTPYGLDYDKPTNVWLVHPVHGPIVREIFDRVAAGESCIAIACDLANRGAPCNGKAWTKRHVRDIVRSTHPIGEYVAHRATRTKVSVPAIVTLALWQRAQDALASRRKSGLRRTRYVYLLEGLGVCGRCGGRMRMRTECRVGNSRWLRPAAYVCENHSPTTPVAFRAKDFVRCPSPPVLVRDADTIAWKTILGEIEDPDLPGELARHRREIGGDHANWERDAIGYRKHLKRLDRVAASVLERFRRGTIEEDGLDVELAAIQRERAVVRAQLATAERAQGLTFDAHKRNQTAVAHVKSLVARAVNSTPEERQGLVRLLVDRGGVVFHDEEIRIAMFVERPAASVQAMGDVQLKPEVTDCIPRDRMKIRVVARRG